MALTLRRKTAQALALRARIVLACADGVDDKAVAARQRVITPQTVTWPRGAYYVLLYYHVSGFEIVLMQTLIVVSINLLILDLRKMVSDLGRR